MEIEILLDEFLVPKRTQFGTVQRSLEMDKVYIKNEEGIWKHCGYLPYAHMTFLPIVGFPQELVPAVAKRCSEMKGQQVKESEAPQLVEPEDEEDDDDELE